MLLWLAVIFGLVALVLLVYAGNDDRDRTGEACTTRVIESDCARSPGRACARQYYQGEDGNFYRCQFSPARNRCTGTDAVGHREQCDTVPTQDRPEETQKSNSSVCGRQCDSRSPCVDGFSCNITRKQCERLHCKTDRECGDGSRCLLFTNPLVSRCVRLCDDTSSYSCHHSEVCLTPEKTGACLDTEGNLLTNLRFCGLPVS